MPSISSIRMRQNRDRKKTHWLSPFYARRSRSLAHSVSVRSLGREEKTVKTEHGNPIGGRIRNNEYRKNASCIAKLHLEVVKKEE